MTLQHYTNTSYKLTKKLTTAYSTSFSLGIKVFKPEYRDPIFAIYGFVRVADEIVDTFHSHDKEYLLEKFTNDTWEAINIGTSTNPVLHAFQKVVNDYGIDRKLISALFLKSMEMDLSRSSYNRENYDEYIYGSAEVVGLMCLKVFVDGDEKRYKELEHSGRMLGAAFQKVNFLRDIQSDINDRGRIYLPGVHHIDYIDDHNKAVVAQEVKSLASQTARATDDITAKITAIQQATRQTVDANGSIQATVEVGPPSPRPTASARRWSCRRRR